MLYSRKRQKRAFVRAHTKKNPIAIAIVRFALSGAEIKGIAQLIPFDGNQNQS